MLHCLEKAMAPHSSTFAWKIPWTEEPGGLQSMGSLRVGHDWATSLSLFTFHALEKEMASHSSVLAWRIPGRVEPGGLPSMGSHRVRHDWSDLAAAAACFIVNAKDFDCVDHNKLWKILKEMGIPDHLTCLPRNQYAGQEATVKTGHGTTDLFQIGKGVCQGYI